MDTTDRKEREGILVSGKSGGLLVVEGRERQTDIVLRNEKKKTDEGWVTQEGGEGKVFWHGTAKKFISPPGRGEGENFYW